MNIPEIQTERLLLRAFRSSDFDAYAEMMADPEVTRYLADGRPSRTELARADVISVIRVGNRGSVGVATSLVLFSPAPSISTVGKPRSIDILASNSRTALNHRGTQRYTEERQSSCVFDDRNSGL